MKEEMLLNIEQRITHWKVTQAEDKDEEMRDREAQMKSRDTASGTMS
jgi:hypothetical protein